MSYRGDAGSRLMHAAPSFRLGCRRAEVPSGRVDHRMRLRSERRRSRLLDYRPVLANPGRTQGFVRLVFYPPDGKRGDGRPPDPHWGGAPRQKNPADRMQTAALLRVSEHPSTRCLEAAQGWIAYFDRCVYGKGSV